MGKEDEIGLEDIFVNFKNVEGVIDETDASVLRETVVDTALAIGGMRAWAIQEAELYAPLAILGDGWLQAATAHHYAQFAFGRPGVADIGSEGEPPPPGILTRWDIFFQFDVNTQGAAMQIITLPKPWKAQTAVPYARNKISMYAKLSNNLAAAKSQPCSVRLQFTYIPVTDKLYREINERWALD